LGNKIKFLFNIYSFVEIKIKNEFIEVDVDATQEFYLTQNDILEDCECDDCQYFYKNFIHKPFKILEIIKKFGVDLSENLVDESTGVWCVRNDSHLLHIFQVYQAKGVIHNPQKEIKYSVIEHGLKMEIRLYQSAFNVIDIELTVNKL